MHAPLKFKANVPTVFGKLLLRLLAVSCLRVLCTYCLLVIGDISVFPVSLNRNPNQLPYLYRAKNYRQFLFPLPHLYRTQNYRQRLFPLTLVILDAAVTGGGGGIVLGVVVAIDVSKINSIII
jgi:hypothetical protein